MTEKRKAMPVSKAKTAYGLLSEIAKLALEEPKRMRMYFWKVTRRTYTGDFLFCSYQGFEREEIPECGTVGCIGGWTETLAGKRRGSATKILGLKGDQADELFMPYRLTRAPNQGTPEHARDVAEHIKQFQQKYEGQLRAHRLARRSGA